MKIIERIGEFIEKHNLFSKDDKILVSFSGGPDSTMLAIALKELGYKITLFYLNHMLREDSEIEEKHVTGFSKEFKIPLIKNRFDVKAFIKTTGLGTEEGARVIRRRFLLSTFQQGFNYIATGHTLDDNVENFFIRLLRGSGPGLRGMKPRDPPFVRPLLFLRKQEILEGLEDMGVEYYIDPSNFQPFSLRNRLRHEVIPLIEEVSPIGIAGIVRSIDDLSDLEDALETIIGKIPFTQYPTHISFPPDKFLGLSSGLRFLLLKRLLNLMDGGLELKRVHLEKLPGKVELSRFVISLSKKWGVIARKWKQEPVVCKIPGKYIFGDFELSFTEEKNKKRIDFSEKIEYFDMKDINLPLIIRRRKRGDKLIPFGRRKEKKLKDIFIDRQVPDVLRDIWPVIEDKYGIIFVPGVIRADRGKVVKETKKLLKIEWRRLEIK